MDNTKILNLWSNNYVNSFASLVTSLKKRVGCPSAYVKHEINGNKVLLCEDYEECKLGSLVICHTEVAGKLFMHQLWAYKHRWKQSGRFPGHFGL